MEQQLDSLSSNALELLHQLVTPKGILASLEGTDNYQRVWARDGIIAGVAGLLMDDAKLIEGLKHTLLTLAKHQHELGMIPSNVPLDDRSSPSYGSLVGRVDSNTWFIIGCCWHRLHTHDEETWTKLLPAVQRCRAFLKSIEYNGKGLIYTPLSGNWADEYPVHGYTFYDNLLRLWGETLYQKLEQDETDLLALRQFISSNYWPQPGMPEDQIYQVQALSALELDQLSHFVAFILPGKYDSRFDAAGNALAMLSMELSELQQERMSTFLAQLSTQSQLGMLPAFWPVITEADPDWNLLAHNFSYRFKNSPGAFHNGGVWPVWMGLFCLGLSAQGMQEACENLVQSFVAHLPDPHNWAFHEYFDTNKKKWEGITQLGYSASGVIFMKLALENKAHNTISAFR